MINEPSVFEVDVVFTSFLVGIIVMPALLLLGLFLESAFFLISFFVLAPYWVWINNRLMSWRSS